jgi:Domain of unknown function (DUF4148)
MLIENSSSCTFIIAIAMTSVFCSGKVNMKSLIFAALIGATATSSAFAQSNPSQNGTTSELASPTQTVASVAPAWAPSPTTGKTRAQVYQELVEAQQDGQMAYLKQLYKGR